MTEVQAIQLQLNFGRKSIQVASCHIYSCKHYSSQPTWHKFCICTLVLGDSNQTSYLSIIEKNQDKMYFVISFIYCIYCKLRCFWRNLQVVNHKFTTTFSCYRRFVSARLVDAYQKKNSSDHCTCKSSKTTSLRPGSAVDLRQDQRLPPAGMTQC